MLAMSNIVKFLGVSIWICLALLAVNGELK